MGSATGTDPVGELLASLGLTDAREIGRGATSTVFVARQAHLSRDVALKVFSAQLTTEKARRRFERECQALGAVSAHPNVVTLLSNGFDRDRRPYIMMEYCPGGSLYDVINTSGPLPLAEVLRLGVKLGSALQLAHDNGLLHRDIKPANVLLTAWREPALADFGIAGDTAELSVTVGESLTPLYAAPEVLESGGGSPASDIWSLSSTLYALLLGHAPYAGTNDGLLAVLNRIVHEPLPPLNRDDVPEVVVDVIRHGMQKDPSARMTSARALSEALQSAQEQLGLTVTEYLSLSGEPAAVHKESSEHTQLRPKKAPAAEDLAVLSEPTTNRTVLSSRRREAMAAVEGGASSKGDRRVSRRALTIAASGVALVGITVGVAMAASGGGSTSHVGGQKPVSATITAPKTADSFAWSCQPQSAVMACHFTYAVPATGADSWSYEWLLNGSPLPGNGPALSRSFGRPGSYRVGLEVLRGDGTMVTSYTRDLNLARSVRTSRLSVVDAKRRLLAVSVGSAAPACRPTRALLEHRGARWQTVRTVRLSGGRATFRVASYGDYRAVVSQTARHGGFCGAATSHVISLRKPKQRTPTYAPTPAPAPTYTYTPPAQPVPTSTRTTPPPPPG